MPSQGPRVQGQEAAFIPHNKYLMRFSFFFHIASRGARAAHRPSAPDARDDPSRINRTHSFGREKLLGFSVGGKKRTVVQVLRIFIGEHQKRFRNNIFWTSSSCYVSLGGAVRRQKLTARSTSTGDKSGAVKNAHTAVPGRDSVTAQESARRRKIRR